jgi:flagellin-like hook-associated protein FlgL
MSSNYVSLNTSLLSNLSSLKSTQSLLDNTELNVTSGKKVNSVLDDPISYFKSEDHLANATDLQSLKDNMSEAIQTIKAGADGITAITDLINDAKSLATSALSATTSGDSAAYETQFNDLLDQIDTLASDSGYNGVNLLGGTTQSLDVNFNSGSTGTTSKLTLKGVDVQSGQTNAGADGLKLSTVTSGAWWDATATTPAANKTAIQAVITKLNAAKVTLRSDAKTLSNESNIITSRQTYTDSMATVLQNGSANLVNADTNEESVKLTTLQTQQSLAISSLSISKSASQSVLSLLR